MIHTILHFLRDSALMPTSFVVFYVCWLIQSRRIDHLEDRIATLEPPEAPAHGTLAQEN